jgi:transcriptional regulator with XRE-family HTH domain
MTRKTRVSTGIAALDRRLDGLFIGDNVIWYDEAGSLAFPFCLRFLRESEEQGKPIVYITFDRSPKTLIEELGPLADNPSLTILDCFTHGKGDGSALFAKFYEQSEPGRFQRIVKVAEPQRPEKVSEAIYTIHQGLRGDVRFIFESLTGMQDLWEGEESILKFYSRACPRLYELETIAYWIAEKGAHSSRLKAHINQIAQVAVELGLKRGRSTLAILKAHNRRPDALDKPEPFWIEGPTIAFDADKPLPEKIELGARLKALRAKQGLAQKELAGLVGVTPSTISQIESNQIYPSLPALFKMAQILSVEAGYFFQKGRREEKPIVYSGWGTAVDFPNLPRGVIRGRQLLPADLPARIEPYLIEMPAGKKLVGHFFVFKGDEFGLLTEGRLQVTLKNGQQEMEPGDVIYLSSDLPTQWKNIGEEAARLIWIKIL